MTNLQNLKVEIVFALLGKQTILQLEVPVGSSIEEVVNQSRIKEMYTSESLGSCPVGIWGEVKERSTLVGDGDRIELYRLLASDPKDKRRNLALLGKSMSQRNTLINLD